jgi:hypothetical protein
MSPCDYEPFSKIKEPLPGIRDNTREAIKEPLRGIRDNTREAIIGAVGQSLLDINRSGHADGVHALHRMTSRLRKRRIAVNF